MAKNPTQMVKASELSVFDRIGGLRIDNIVRDPNAGDTHYIVKFDAIQVPVVFLPDTLIEVNKR